MRELAQIGIASAAAAWGEHTARVQSLVLRGPFTTEVRFGGSAVRAHSAVKAAGYSIVVEEPASGDHLGLDREVTGPVYLAEIRRPPRSHQCLQAAFPLGTHDLYLKVAAAGGTASVVGGPAWCERTGVLHIHYWKAPSFGRRRRQHPGHRTAIFHDQETVTLQPSLLLRSVHAPRGWPSVPIRGTLGKGPLLPQIFAADVKSGVHVQLTSVLPDLRKRDVLGVADEPGRLMIEGGCSLFERSYAKGDRKAATLRAEGTAGGHCGIRCF